MASKHFEEISGVTIAFWCITVVIGAIAWWQGVIRKASLIDDPWPTRLPLPLPMQMWPKVDHLIMERLGEGKLPNAEDLASSSDEDALFGACSDGWIKKLLLPSGTVTNWTKIPKNGRPLGLTLGLHGELIACEPSLGLLNITEGNVNVLTDNACGIKFKFADGVDISQEDGSIYFTDASTKHGYGQSYLDVLEGRPNGRLLKYDPSTRKTSVLATNLFFPNGVAISSNQHFLVFCETSKVRCQRLWLHGDRKGEMEIFIDNLPGYPDNIRRTRRGTFWIGLVGGRSLWQETLFSFPWFKHLYAMPKSQEALNVALRSTAKVMEVSDEGKPLRYWEANNGESIGYVTTALEVGDHVYLGGLAFDYVVKMKLKEYA